MPSPLLSKIKKQVAQIAKDVAQETLKEPGKIVETAASQVGIAPVSEAKPAANKSPSEGEIKKLEQKDDTFKKVETQKLRGQLEAEIAAARMQRIQAGQVRKVVEQQAENQRQATESQQSPLMEVSSKKKRGMFGNWGRRVKTAQQQAMPEKSASRRSG